MEISGLEENIGTLLEKSAAYYGEKRAIYFDNENLGFSSKQLTERVNQFANALRSKGIKRGDHVGVWLPKCPEFPQPGSRSRDWEQLCFHLISGIRLST